MQSIRTLVLALLAVLGVAAAQPALAQYNQQQVVNQALSTVERMKTDTNFQKNFQPRLSKAHGVLIVPSLYKGGFILGGQYGDGVMMVRGADGTWSYPAFYSMTGGSLGLQIGVESAAIMFLMMNDKGVNAVMNSQFKFGADAGVTFAVVGAGMNASTGTDTSADIIAFSLSGVGLYGGLSLEGTAVSPRESWNASYYGQNVAARAILLDRAVTNTQADRLRDFLAR